MSTFKRFEEIRAWQEARILALLVHSATQDSSFHRDFALRDQIRKSAVSVMSNIAEGYERHRRAEFIRFLQIAKGSGGEVKSQLYLALDFGYLTDEEFDELWTQADKTTALIHSLVRYLKKSKHEDR